MKLALIADTHFGLKRFEEDAFVQAERALISADELADVIILAGDIFDTRIPRPETLSRAFEIFKKVKKPMFAIHGTHERRAKGLVNPIQMMATLEMVRDVHAKTETIDIRGEKLAVSGLGGVPDEYAKSALEAISPKPLTGAFNVFVLHQSVVDFVFTGKDILDLDDLPSGFDLYLCGHMHKYATAMDGKFIIPGSTVLTQLKREEMGEKGYVLYDTKASGKERIQFVPVKTRQFFFEEMEFKDAHLAQVRKDVEETVARLKKKAEDLGEKEPIIRIVIKGTLAAGVSPGDLSLTHVLASSRKENHGEQFIFIDNELNESMLKGKIDKIREARARKTSIGEFGMGILKEKLKEKKCGIENPEELFEKLCDSGAEAAFENIKKRKG